MSGIGIFCESPLAFLLAFPDATTRQRAHRKVAGGNSTNQRNKPSLSSRRQEGPWFGVGSRTTTPEIEGNYGGVGGADRLEEAVSAKQFADSNSEFTASL